jgi:NAD(P)H dehydrogenase (quinone)
MGLKHAAVPGQKVGAVLVTGASGALGRRVLEMLVEGRHGAVVAATRHPEKLRDLEARGVILRQADFDQPASLAAAFAGVERLLLVSTDALGQPGRRFAQHQAAIAAAKKAKVAHVVYTSIVRPEEGSPVLLAEDHRKTEEALAASGMHFTALRNNLYAENLLMALPHALATGVLASATGGGAAAYVLRDDCARAAASVLAAKHAKRGVFDITGSVALTHAQIAALVSRASGRRVVAQEVPWPGRGRLQSGGLRPPRRSGCRHGHRPGLLRHSHTHSDLTAACPTARLLVARVATLGSSGRGGPYGRRHFP